MVITARIPQAETPSSHELREVVRDGLTRHPRRLPPWLLYDARGSALFERITALPEYYPTRTERAILTAHAHEIVAGAAEPLTVFELGAGTASKTQILLAALVSQRGRADFVPVDVSPAPLADAAWRLARELPAVRVSPWVATHEQAVDRIARVPGRKLVLFLGSSIGNYEHGAARALLAGLRASLAPGDSLVLGTDLKKDPAVLLPAYADAGGVTCAFNKNLLVRLNRELGARFDLDRFAHVALWNEAASRVEMHLESLVDQVVHLEAVSLSVALAAGERIHTESSIKYEAWMVDDLLAAAGLARDRTYHDARRWFGLHVARAV